MGDQAIKDQVIKDDEYYALFYIQNISVVWPRNIYMAGPIVFTPIYALYAFFLKLSILKILLIMIPILSAILFAPYVAEGLYRKGRLYQGLYSDAGKRYAEHLAKIRFRTVYFEWHLFWETDLFLDFLYRLITFWFISLTCWYFQADGFRNKEALALIFFFPYLAYAYHWVAVWWWWKHKIVGSDRYKELYAN